MHSFLCARPFREGEEDGPQNHTCLKCAATESAQDASPPVVVAIKENVDNSSISTVTDLPPVKKMKLIEVATKQKRKVKDLPECLSSFSLENKDWVTFGLEISENAMQEMLSGMKDSQAECKMRDKEEYEMLKADNKRKKVAHEMKKVAHEMLKADNERKKLVHEMMKEDNERKNVDKLAATSSNLLLPQFVRDTAKEQLEEYWIKKLGIMVEEANEN